MLPQSHVTYTLAAYDLLKAWLPDLPEVDYRLLALAAVAPDLIDKPLAALYFYRHYRSAVLFAHTLLVHLGVLSLALSSLRKAVGEASLCPPLRQRDASATVSHRALALGPKSAWGPYLLAFNGHALLDRLWLFKNTWYWPFTGWRFHVWRKEGSEQKDIRLAYWYAFTRRPELWGWEVGGLVAGLWFVWRHQLYRPGRLKRLVFTGRAS